MKKTSFFCYLLMLGFFISLTFNACKDDPEIPPPTTNGNILKSKSFEVTELNDSVSGDFALHFHQPDTNFDPPIQKLPLKCSYVVRNITNDKVKYHTKIEAIESIFTHKIEQCMGDACLTNTVSEMFGLFGEWKSNSNWPNVFVPNGTTHPDLNSYIKMWAGETAEDVVPGLNKFRVTYTNAADATDYVSFILTFNFYAPTATPE